MGCESSGSGSSGRGIGFVGLLTILFIGLKLTGCINWSWWLVLSPIWIVAILTVALLSIAGALLYGASVWGDMNDGK